MILVTAAVEHDLGDARRPGAIGDDLADSFCRSDVAATLQSFFGFLVDRAGRDKRAAAAVVNHLRVDVPNGTIDVQAGTFRRADHARAHAQMDAAALLIFRQLANWYRSHVVSPLEFSVISSATLNSENLQLKTNHLKLFLSCSSLGAGLACLLLQAFASDADALLLVRVGRAQ